jgi:hypothetical protein
MDILVNNAGMKTHTLLLETTKEQFDLCMGMDLKSAFFGAQCAARQIITQRGGGHIINISSVHEDWPVRGNVAYCRAKRRLLPRHMHRIVILGRFFGRATAQRLDHFLRYDEDVDVTLISDTNFLLYTPMLADVAGGTIEPHRAVPPLRTLPRRKAQFQEAAIQATEVAAQKVKVICAMGDRDECELRLPGDRAQGCHQLLATTKVD